MALAAAANFVAHKEGFLVGAIIVDHGLAPDSGIVADKAFAQVHKAGIVNAFVEKVIVGREGGLEAAARRARYAALDSRADREGGLTPHILTGHTMDDQAETVLLALARGSGARALAGMAVKRGR